MALRPQDKVTERELSDVVVDKLNYLGNLKLSENIEVGGDHGAFKDGEILTKGTRVHDVLQGILNDDFQRTYIFPMLELTGVEKNIEVGNTLSMTIVPVFTQNDAGPLTRFKLERSINSGVDYTTLYDTDHIMTYTEDSVFIIDANDILSFRATVWFDKGPVKVVNGEEVNGSIEAGSISTELVISGTRKCFYGAEPGITFAVQDSNQVRALPMSITFDNNRITYIPLEVKAGTTRITFAYPSFANDPDRIISKKLGYDVKDVFEKSTIRVKGANGYTDIIYKVFTYIPDAPYPSDDLYTLYTYPKATDTQDEQLSEDYNSVLKNLAALQEQQEEIQNKLMNAVYYK